MLCTTIDNHWQLRDEFIKFNRDYYSPAQYEAIFDYYNNIDGVYFLDVIAICSNLIASTWEELYEEFGLEDPTYIRDKLEENTYVLHDNDDGVLYFVY